jgi:hypothetical protein
MDTLKHEQNTLTCLLYQKKSLSNEEIAALNCGHLAMTTRAIVYNIIYTIVYIIVYIICCLFLDSRPCLPVGKSAGMTKRVRE